MNKLFVAIYCTGAVVVWQFVYDCMYHAAYAISKISGVANAKLKRLADIIDENFPDENS